MRLPRSFPSGYNQRHDSNTFEQMQTTLEAHQSENKHTHTHTITMQLVLPGKAWIYHNLPPGEGVPGFGKTGHQDGFIFFGLLERPRLSLAMKLTGKKLESRSAATIAKTKMDIVKALSGKKWQRGKGVGSEVEDSRDLNHGTTSSSSRILQLACQVCISIFISPCTKGQQKRLKSAMLHNPSALASLRTLPRTCVQCCSDIEPSRYSQLSD